MSSGASASSDPRIHDFTEESYRRILEDARRHWSFEPFGTLAEEPHALWRHDVDFSVHRAARLAEIECEAGVLATYFFSLHSPFYNLFEAGVTERARYVLSVGHRLGLHFEADFYGSISGHEELHDRLSDESAILERLLEQPVEAFSFHNPDFGGRDINFDSDEIAGLVNAYGHGLRERYSYVSDSNGVWRHRRLAEVVGSGAEPLLHVLTHPEWWQAAPMSPRRRVARCVEGRAAATLAAYDRLLADAERPNVR
jgi:hypothetical protein